MEKFRLPKKKLSEKIVGKEVGFGKFRVSGIVKFVFWNQKGFVKHPGLEAGPYIILP